MNVALCNATQHWKKPPLAAGRHTERHAYCIAHWHTFVCVLHAHAREPNRMRFAPDGDGGGSGVDGRHVAQQAGPKVLQPVWWWWISVRNSRIVAVVGRRRVLTSCRVHYSHFIGFRAARWPSMWAGLVFCLFCVCFVYVSDFSCGDFVSRTCFRNWLKSPYALLHY